MALPHPVAAQGTCEGASNPTAANPPTEPLATLELASTATTTKIECNGLNQGLELDLNGAQITTTGSDRTLSIDAEGDGDKDVKVMGDITINSGNRGIHMVRDGAGLLELNLGKNSAITSSGNNKAIYLWHKGKAVSGAGVKTKGINIVSSASINISGSAAGGKTGIFAETSDAPMGTTIPISIHLTGGSIRAESTGVRDDDRGRGVFVQHVAKGDIKITVDPEVMIGMSGKSLGASAIDVDMKPTGAGDIEITHEGQIYAVRGIHARMQDPGGEGRIEGNIVIKTGADSKIVTNLIGESPDTTWQASWVYPHGIYGNIEGAARIGTVTITHRGMIDAAGYGIQANGRQAATVTMEKGSSIKSKERGIDAGSYGKVTVTHGGLLIDAGGYGIKAVGTQDVKVTLKAGSRIKAKEAGIYAEDSGTGKVTVKTEKDSSIVSDMHGILVRHSGTEKRSFHVAVYGTVTGGTTCTDTKTGRDKCAGVYVQRKTQTGDKVGGGTIVIGPWAHVKATSGVAIEVDGKAGDVAVILEQDEDGFVGHVEGQILHPKGADRTRDKAVEGEVTIKTRTLSGTEEGLEAGDHVYRRGDRMGVYVKAFKAELATIEEPAGYEFKDVPGDWRLYSHRARLYEVLPSVLLGLVDLTPYSTRMAVPRRTIGGEVVLESSKGEHVAVPGSRAGVWVRLAVRDGERMADTSTTARDIRSQVLAWDVKQTDFEAGLEVPTDDRLVLGVSAHYRQSEATVKTGGTMEASGTGVGVSLTWTDGSGLYVDGQLSYTRFFDVEMTSSRHGVITSKGGGSGLAVGVEVGQPMSMGDMAVIPRGGLSWSSVDMDAFDEPTTIDEAGRVTPGSNQSVQGRVGVLAELGSGEADRRLYASLDLEHEFASEHEVMAAGTRLEAEVKPTWVRLGVGGSMSLGGGDTTRLTGDAFYATAGSDNTDFGGGLSVTFHF